MAAVEKSPLSSKKFVAYLLAEITWKLILVVALFTFKTQLSDASVWGWWFMITTVVIAGFIEVAFIGGQAWLDKYVRVATIVSNGPTKRVGEDEKTEDQEA
jgi:hypothetical protein